MHPEENFHLKRDLKRTDQFAFAEYSALREEVKLIVGQIDALETSSLIFSGAVWAWIVTQEKWKPIYDAVVFLPFGLSVLFYIKRRSLHHAVHELGNHIMRIETHFNLPEDIGWEHHLRAKGVRHF
jgi:hypothetical protein